MPPPPVQIALGVLQLTQLKADLPEPKQFGRVAASRLLIVSVCSLSDGTLDVRRKAQQTRAIRPKSHHRRTIYGTVPCHFQPIAF